MSNLHIEISSFKLNNTKAKLLDATNYWYKNALEKKD